jgi:hypothetical protein
MRLTQPALATCLCVLGSARAEAMAIHIVRPGETVTSIAAAYYGQPGREVVLRAVNQMSAEGEVELQVGEPLLIPEQHQRVVRQGDSWESLARDEMGTEERAWLLAEANQSDPVQRPEAGRIIVIPYLMPLAIGDGLPAVIERFYPGESPRQVARMLRRLNPNLRARVQRGTRIVLPVYGLEMLASRRAEIERADAAQRRPEDAERQRDASAQLARLPDLLAAGSFVELVALAGRISASADLTEAQQVTLHRYLGQAYVALDRPDLATAEFVRVVTLQPDFQLDEVTTSPTVLEVFRRARERARDVDRR